MSGMQYLDYIGVRGLIICSEQCFQVFIYDVQPTECKRVCGGYPMLMVFLKENERHQTWEKRPVIPYQESLAGARCDLLGKTNSHRGMKEGTRNAWAHLSVIGINPTKSRVHYKVSLCIQLKFWTFFFRMTRKFLKNHCILLEGEQLNTFYILNTILLYCFIKKHFSKRNMLQ